MDTYTIIRIFCQMGCFFFFFFVLREIKNRKNDSLHSKRTGGRDLIIPICLEVKKYGKAGGRKPNQRIFIFRGFTTAPGSA